MEKPIIFPYGHMAPKNIPIIDTINSALKELFFIRHPQFKEGMEQAKKPLAEFVTKNKNAIKSVWVYYPWLNKVVRCPEEKIFFEIKTARNKNFITQEEQNRYRNFRVGIMGMSIGSNILWPLVASGGPRFIKISDADTIELSNLNRMLAPLSAYGENKAIFMGKKIYEMDPFLNLECWENYIDENNIEKFISGLNLLIDEIDNLSLKFLSRNIAKKYKIPLIMVTNVGNNVILDIERFDVEPNRPIFHGLLKGIRINELTNLSYKEWVKIATKIVGPKYLSQKMKLSIQSIGKTTAAVPQISPTALIAGSVVTQAIMRLVSKNKVKSGRIFFKIDNYFK